MSADIADILNLLVSHWVGIGRREEEEGGTNNGRFTRVVKGVDLRSTGGNSAWVRTPQLTSFR